MKSTACYTYSRIERIQTPDCEGKTKYQIYHQYNVQLVYKADISIENLELKFIFSDNAIIKNCVVAITQVTKSHIKNVSSILFKRLDINNPINITFYVYNSTNNIQVVTENTKVNVKKSKGSKVRKSGGRKIYFNWKKWNLGNKIISTLTFISLIIGICVGIKVLFFSSNNNQNNGADDKDIDTASVKNLINDKNDIIDTASLINDTSSYTDTLIEQVLKPTTVVQNDENIKTKPYFCQSKTLFVGEAFIDTLTGVTIGIDDINSFNKADGNLSLPGSNSVPFFNVSVGEKWHFTYLDKTYIMILRECKYFAECFRVEVKEVNKL